MSERKATPRRQPFVDGSKPGNDQLKVLAWKKAGGSLLGFRLEHQPGCIKHDVPGIGLISTYRCQCDVKLFRKDGMGGWDVWEGDTQ